MIVDGAADGDILIRRDISVLRYGAVGYKWFAYAARCIG